jgi:predicted ATPase
MKFADGYSFGIPAITGPHTNLPIRNGRLTFFLGANGTGKSSLISMLSGTHIDKVVRIDAYREVTLRSSAVMMTGEGRNSLDKNYRNFWSREDSRYFNHAGSTSTDQYLYDLKEASNKFNDVQLQRLKAFDPGTEAAAAALKEVMLELSPIERVEKVLRAGGLELSFEFDVKGTLNVKRGERKTYGVQQLSDGERAAFILATAVITAPKEALVLIDEPERHLHRSISAPLIHSLLEERIDCAFVVSTHDISLPLGNPNSSALLLRSYQHDPRGWECSYLDSIDSIDEQLAEAILGSRRRILFVEGIRTSLDLQLYSRLFPNLSVKAQNSCSDVIEATKGVNASSQEHWVEAYGLVDLDMRPKENVTELAKQSVFALDLHAVESLYYHPQTINLVAEEMGKLGTVDAEAVKAEIDTMLLEAFSKSRDSLINDAACRMVRNRTFSQLPKPRDFRNGKIPTSGLDQETAKAICFTEGERFDAMVAWRDIAGLVARYKVKFTGIPGEVARLLALKDNRAFENVVRNLASKDDNAADVLRRLVGPFSSAVSQ